MRLDELPSYACVARSADEIGEQARALGAMLRPLIGGEDSVELVSTDSYVGGGSLPTQRLPSWALAIRHPTLSPDGLAQRLRQGDPPVIGRIREGALLLDLRAVTTNQQDALVGAFEQMHSH